MIVTPTDIECPICSAQAGEDCRELVRYDGVTPIMRTVPYHHADRVDDAMRAQRWLGARLFDRARELVRAVLA